MCYFTGSAIVVRSPWNKLGLSALAQGHRQIFHLVGSGIQTSDLSDTAPMSQPLGYLPLDATLPDATLPFSEAESRTKYDEYFR